MADRKLAVSIGIAGFLFTISVTAIELGTFIAGDTGATLGAVSVGLCTAMLFIWLHARLRVDRSFSSPVERHFYYVWHGRRYLPALAPDVCSSSAHSKQPLSATSLLFSVPCAELDILVSGYSDTEAPSWSLPPEPAPDSALQPTPTRAVRVVVCYSFACGFARLSAGPLADRGRGIVKRRLAPYVILLLVAIILSIRPSAMWPDMAMRMEDNWENWYWKGQPHPRPDFSLQNAPALFRAEVSLYKGLVAPPAYVHRAVTGWPTIYASFFIEPYVESAGIPPLAMALQHAAWALPTWFVLLLFLYESVRFIRRRLRHRRSVG